LQSFCKPSKSRFDAVGVCHHVGSELSIIPAKFAYQISNEKWFKRHFFLKKLGTSKSSSGAFGFGATVAVVILESETGFLPKGLFFKIHHIF